MRYKFILTLEYSDWFVNEPLKSQNQIASRLLKIESDAHFGDYKKIDDYIWELKWSNGRRIYFSFLPINNIVLLLGGNKNGQDQDINKAKKIFRKYSQI